MRNKSEVNKILAALDKEYHDAWCTLDHRDPLQLLVATILSAQCTDERVNLVTADLFKKYKKAADYANAALTDLEDDIRSTGFFRNKAKSINALGQALEEKYKGQVPDKLDELVKLPGVGRKTANVVLGTAFNIPGLAVDTHVSRFAGRTGLSNNKNAVKIEFDLMNQIPKKKWVKFSHQVIAHGRRICKARKPDCPICPLLELCPFGQSSQR
ncbi:MAG: endonuclease III [Deltaproteobacteria bacterium]|nr:endonuclease III [Deltaproteobacteria bacterium]MBW2053610.1 endonuclease III [Deltaproteobacteria bacterium]MBW2140810.1 endonuclease III [Deltaproteobacteria bacterium]